jgi:hypothetical protein
MTGRRSRAIWPRCLIIGSAQTEIDHVYIHTYAIETGADDLISAFPGKVQNLFFSPSGNSITITLSGAKKQVAIMQSKKLIQSFTNWEAVGWASESEVILEKNIWGGSEAAPDSVTYRVLMTTGDIATGNIRQFYP